MSRMEAAIQTGAKVMLFFNSHHDEKNTITSEVKAVEAFREIIQDKCACVDYNSKNVFELCLCDKLCNINEINK